MDITTNFNFIEQEKERNSQKGSGLASPWLSLVTCLSSLAQAEKAYASLVFLGLNLGQRILFRKDVSRKESIFWLLNFIIINVRKVISILISFFINVINTFDVSNTRQGGILSWVLNDSFSLFIVIFFSWHYFMIKHPFNNSLQLNIRFQWYCNVLMTYSFDLITNKFILHRGLPWRSHGRVCD